MVVIGNYVVLSHLDLVQLPIFSNKLKVCLPPFDERLSIDHYGPPSSRLHAGEIPIRVLPVRKFLDRSYGNNCLLN